MPPKVRAGPADTSDIRAAWLAKNPGGRISGNVIRQAIHQKRTERVSLSGNLTDLTKNQLA